MVHERRAVQQKSMPIEQSINTLKSVALGPCATDVRLMAVRALGGYVRAFGLKTAYDSLQHVLRNSRIPEIKLQAGAELDRFTEASNTNSLHGEAYSDNSICSVPSIYALGLRAKLLKEDTAFKALMHISVEGATLESSIASDILARVKRI